MEHKFSDREFLSRCEKELDRKIGWNVLRIFRETLKKSGELKEKERLSEAHFALFYKMVDLRGNNSLTWNEAAQLIAKAPKVPDIRRVAQTIFDNVDIDAKISAEMRIIANLHRFDLEKFLQLETAMCDTLANSNLPTKSGAINRIRATTEDIFREVILADILDEG